MSGVKSRLKSAMPTSVMRMLLPLYHWGRAFIANVMFGFPAKGMNVIAITGTNGKTTTSSYIDSILTEAGFKVGVSSTAYFKIGDKVTNNATNMTVTNPFKLQKLLAKMKLARVDWVILEVTSHSLQQQRIWGVPIKMAIVTNLTQDHLDYHGTMENYANAKAKLLKKNPQSIVLNHDDEWFDFFNKYEAEEHKITYGTDEKADVRITRAQLTPNGSEISLTIDKSQDYSIETSLLGKFNVYNATAAVAATYVLHVPKDKIIAGVKKLQAVPGRMENIDEGQPFSVIVDYAHTEDALENVLETLKALTDRRIILVFGATGDRDKTKRPGMGKIAAKLADRIILTDEEPYSEDPAKIRKDVMKGIIEAKAKGKTDEIEGRREAIAKAFKIAKKGDTVLITGMGHQVYMTTNEGKIKWDEREVAREELEKAKKTSKKTKK